MKKTKEERKSKNSKPKNGQSKDSKQGSSQIYRICRNLSQDQPNPKIYFREAQDLIQQRHWLTAYELLKTGEPYNQLTHPNYSWQMTDLTTRAAHYSGHLREAQTWYAKLFQDHQFPFGETLRLVQNQYLTVKQLYQPSQILKIYCECGGASHFFLEHALALATYLIIQKIPVQFIQTPIQKLTPDSTSLYIFYGLHRCFDKPFPFQRYCAYNMEHLDSMWEHDYYKKSPKMFQKMMKALEGSVELWDFSLMNGQIYPRLSHNTHYRYVPLALSPVYQFDQNRSLTSTQLKENQVIDVLFLGGLNQRRKKILRGIRAQGLKVHDTPCWERAGKEQLHQKAKIILNLNNVMPIRCNLARIIPALSNGYLVITEPSNPKDDAVIRPYVIMAEPEKIPEVCAYYARNQAARQVFLEKLSHQREEMSRLLNYGNFLNLENLRGLIGLG